MEKDKVELVKNFAFNVRKNILKMAFEAGSSSSHLGGALSIVEIVSFLFSYQMKIDKKNISWEDRDRFILSKGHACLAYYAALAEIGFIDKNELNTFEKDDSNLLGHPVLNKKLGIDFSTGSLGMGLSIAIGLSIAAKKKKKDFKVYVILGDGENNEGSVWEAAMSAPNFNLDNLCVIIDKNNFQQTGTNKEIMNTESLPEKWKSFGWEVSEANGHDIIELFNFFEKKSPKPKLLIANTVKGKGISFSENNNDWHHAVLTKNFYEKALNELETKYK
tara:strand:+ start:265 stop:1092 length:828 start_codon:yes stop_codon:yes gene_type:complete